MTRTDESPSTTKMFRRMVNASTGKPRVSLITGSGSKAGIGRAIANIFVREGGKVVLSDLPSREQEGDYL